MDIYEICTPIDRCMCVHEGAIDGGVIDGLVQNQFDQAPVKSSDGKVLGLISTEYLFELSKAGKSLWRGDPLIRHDEVHILATLRECLECLKLCNSALVHVEQDEYSNTQDCDGFGPSCERVKCHVGLVTLADLNHHAVRNHLYPYIAEFEALLARHIQLQISDADQWLKYLTREDQARILGYVELAKRENADIGPIAYLTLTDLLKITMLDERLREPLGFSSRTAFEKFKGPLPDFRNAIMHMTRPLIVNTDDVVRIVHFIDSILAVNELIRKVTSYEERSAAEFYDYYDDPD